MLHVDAKGDTYTNPADTLDDVVVTPQGRIGVGTLHPQARLHIVSPDSGAIRIADGTEGGGKILISDDDGRAHWTSLVGSWYAALKGGESLGDPNAAINTLEGWPDFTYTSYEESLPGCVNLAEGSIEAPYTATYRVTITGKGHIDRPGQSAFLVYIRLNVAGLGVFSPHQHSYTSFGALNFGFMAHLSLNAGEVITMRPMRDHDNRGNLYTEVMLHVELIQ
jgi:hypothetical protein